MCQASPLLAFQKSPFLGPQSPPFKSEASPVLDSHKSPLFRCLTPEKILESKTDDEKGAAVSKSSPTDLEHHANASSSPSSQSQRKRGSAISLKLDLSPNAADKVTCLKDNKDLLFIEDVKLASVETGDSEQLQTLLCAVRELWTEVHFGGDCVEFMEKDSALKLTMFVRVESLPDNTQNISLVGFIVYKLHPIKKYLSVRRLAVSPVFRRQGHAGQLMKWCVRQPLVVYLALTSTVKALDFYKAFGFRKVETWHTGGTAHPDDEVELGQVYMEYRPGGKGKGKGARRKACR